MRQLLLLSLLIASLLSSCTFGGNETRNAEAIAGDWLILYPDHDLDNAAQRQAYRKAQDSIVVLLGLKTIRFKPGGVFQQTDSIYKPPGKWHFNPENNKLFIRNAGKGLDFFQGTLLGIENDTMRVLENVALEGQTIRLTWFLKRITDKKVAALFSHEANGWRKQSGAETDATLRRRVKAMLNYYSAYFEMVSKESAYFSQARVLLPFSYYQHGMGLKPFSEKSPFRQLFHDTKQAQQAHAILSTAMDELKYQSFPRADNFVIEYSLFLRQLADTIKDE